MPRILLVEDDPDVRFVMEHVLVDEGHQVDTAISFEGGADLLRRADYDYDLVLSDGRLPDGTGMSLADIAKEKGVPTLIVTGYAFNLRGEEGVDLSLYDVLLKPVRPRELVEAVSRALNPD